MEKLDSIVKRTDVLASTPSGAVSRRVVDAKRWAASGKPLDKEAQVGRKRGAGRGARGGR